MAQQESSYLSPVELAQLDFTRNQSDLVRRLVDRAIKNDNYLHEAVILNLSMVQEAIYNSRGRDAVVCDAVQQIVKPHLKRQHKTLKVADILVSDFFVSEGRRKVKVELYLRKKWLGLF